MTQDAERPFSWSTCSSADALRVAGSTLFELGAWMHPTASLLDVDKRRLQRMATGAVTIPTGLLIDLSVIVDACASVARNERREALTRIAIGLRAVSTRAAPPED